MRIELDTDIRRVTQTEEDCDQRYALDHVCAIPAGEGEALVQATNNLAAVVVPAKVVGDMGGLTFVPAALFGDSDRDVRISDEGDYQYLPSQSKVWDEGDLWMSDHHEFRAKADERSKFPPLPNHFTFADPEKCRVLRLSADLLHDLAKALNKYRLHASTEVTLIIGDDRDSPIFVLPDSDSDTGAIGVFMPLVMEPNSSDDKEKRDAVSRWNVRVASYQAAAKAIAVDLTDGNQ